MGDANPDRGELSIELEGVAHVLRPSYEAIVAIEAKTGRAIEDLANAAGNLMLATRDAAIIVTECVRAQGKAVKDQALQHYGEARVGELIQETGKLIVVKQLQYLLFLAATGGYDAKGNPKALPTAATTEPTPSAATDA